MVNGGVGDFLHGIRKCKTEHLTWMTLFFFCCSMHMLPASHGNGYFKHAAPEGHHIDYHMVDLPNPDDVSWF